MKRKIDQAAVPEGREENLIIEELSHVHIQVSGRAHTAPTGSLNDWQGAMENNPAALTAAILPPRARVRGMACPGGVSGRGEVWCGGDVSQVIWADKG